MLYKPGCNVHLAHESAVCKWPQVQGQASQRVLVYPKVSVQVYPKVLGLGLLKVLALPSALVLRLPRHRRRRVAKP
jgi:hypothetical protein